MEEGERGEWPGKVQIAARDGGDTARQGVAMRDGDANRAGSSDMTSWISVWKQGDGVLRERGEGRGSMAAEGLVAALAKASFRRWTRQDGSDVHQS